MPSIDHKLWSNRSSRLKRSFNRASAPASVPSELHRLKWANTVSHGPSSSGRSRQGAPLAESNKSRPSPAEPTSAVAPSPSAWETRPQSPTIPHPTIHVEPSACLLAQEFARSSLTRKNRKRPVSKQSLESELTRTQRHPLNLRYDRCPIDLWPRVEIRRQIHSAISGSARDVRLGKIGSVGAAMRFR